VPRGRALAFAGEGKVTAHFCWDELSNINAIVIAWNTAASMGALWSVWM
jgi:hypothetical protein